MDINFKIINDPVHGFVRIPHGLVLAIVEHPVFQRLRDIKQLGLTNLVYPGATHSRLSHALGAMHLMREAIAVLREKGVVVTPEEEEASAVAMLLHDIGHGPFSHALERKIVYGVSHEELSLALMRHINKEMGGKIDMAISVFTGEYHKKFLHQLVSGQLDVDRLDYLKRDSFFSGVAEGMIGLERIIKMMNVSYGNLVIEEKGIYSIEKFLISRRLMYWQVYLHKTVVSAEQLLIALFERARYISESGNSLPGSPAINYFLTKREICCGNYLDEVTLELFTRLDDTDVMSAIKQWQYSDDQMLSSLCKMITVRDLPKIKISDKEFSKEEVDGLKYDLIFTGEIYNKGYDSDEGEIGILSKDGMVRDVYKISDMLSARAFSQITKKYFLCTANLN